MHTHFIPYTQFALDNPVTLTLCFVSAKCLPHTVVYFKRLILIAQAVFFFEHTLTHMLLIIISMPRLLPVCVISMRESDCTASSACYFIILSAVIHNTDMAWAASVILENCAVIFLYQVYQ